MKPSKKQVSQTKATNKDNQITPPYNDEQVGKLVQAIPQYMQGQLVDYTQNGNGTQLQMVSDCPFDRNIQWNIIREEAQQEATNEPILSSYYYASVIEHDTFEKSLAFVLATKLASTTMQPTQLFDTFYDTFHKNQHIVNAAAQDIEAFFDRDPACHSRVSALLNCKGFHAVSTHRIANVLNRQNRILLSKYLQSQMSEVFSIDIHPRAQVGVGILVDHGTGVVIGETAVVGNQVSIMQGVTLGGTGKETGDRHPKIRDNVLIGAHATILGNIEVGTGAQVGAGSLVLSPVESRTMVAGSPAKFVGRVRGIPALSMEISVSRDVAEDYISQQVYNIVPYLSGDNYKSQFGRIGIIGGSVDFAGAAYYAASTSLKVGADLAHVLCSKENGQIIKSLNPEITVQPILGDSEVLKQMSQEQINKELKSMQQQIDQQIIKFTSIIIGPILGHDKYIQNQVKYIIQKAVEAKKPCIIDGEALEIIQQNPDLVVNNPQLILTPNSNELKKLAESQNIIIDQVPTDFELRAEICNKVSEKLGGVIIVSKGKQDLIANNEIAYQCSTVGSARRIAGQGNILNGAMAVLMSWIYTSTQIQEERKKGNLLVAAYGACKLTRTANRLAFTQKRLSMTVKDMLNHIDPSVDSVLTPI